ncbi:hypothetical protein STSP2_01907 [Anaerohalosphaera lusitana]|uniref:Uncharacterized protein n=1 Tax=Anaerohalosphaera lusitana TaxID=1936003 RepID=A0A1U9NLM6_9BACT|nr:hypothetical protein [Anaerohalosphaera lusitana]AQT68735.1 hypothetical protein STSP2_01907 [Anaerohalosphaera lusitana]
MPLYLPDDFWLLADSLWTDFVISFTLFTSVCYAVLSRRLNHHRPAAAASTAIGLALSLSLTFWQSANNFSLADLGPLAVSFAAVVIAVVIFGVFRQVVGSLPAAMLSFGVCLVTALSPGLNPPISHDLIALVAFLIVAAALYMVLTNHGQPRIYPQSTPPQSSPDKQRQPAQLSASIEKQICQAEQNSTRLENDPQNIGQLQRQIEDILPKTSALTDQMARLRKQAAFVKNGQLQRIKKLRMRLMRTPPEQRAAVAANMKKAYKELKFDDRIERLDYAVAETEKRVRDCLNRSIQLLNAGDTAGLIRMLDRARRLQRHNQKLETVIERSKEKLIGQYDQFEQSQSRNYTKQEIKGDNR